MAFEVNGGLDISLLAAADLSSSQFLGIKVDSNGKAALASTGDLCIGVLQNAPASGAAAQIRVQGVTKMLTATTIAKGDFIKTDSAAKAGVAVKGKTDTSDTGAAADALLGSHVLGVALQGGSSGDYVSVLLLHLGAIPTTAS